MSRFVLSTVVLVGAFCVVSAALAHGGDPRVEISPERLHPGAELSVRGVDFSYEDDVALVLTGHNRNVRLGHVTADAEGVFSTSVVLPADLAEGIYMLRAATEHHHALRPAIGIEGAPVTRGEEGGRRDQEDSLLSAMPTTPAPAPAAQTSAATGRGATRGFTTVLAAAAVLCTFAFAGLALNRRRRRARQPSPPG